MARRGICSIHKDMKDNKTKNVFVCADTLMLYGENTPSDPLNKNLLTNFV